MWGMVKNKKNEIRRRSYRARGAQPRVVLLLGTTPADPSTKTILSHEAWGDSSSCFAKIRGGGGEE